jgi:AcrR family transcriptional regulator
MAPDHPSPERELRWIRPPAQDRSQRTLERILDATEALLNERPFDQVSMAAIAKAAKASLSSIYARFESKAVLLRALHERFVAESAPTTEHALSPDAWVGTPLRVIVEQLCVFLVELNHARRGLKRALLVASVEDPEVRGRSVELSAATIAGLAGLFAARRAEMGHPDPHLAAEMLHRVVFAYLDQLVLYGDDDAAGHPRPLSEHAAELASVCAAYLQIHEGE